MKVTDDIIKKTVHLITTTGWSQRDKLIKIFEDFEADIRQNCMTEINALEDYVHKGDTLSGTRSTFDIHQAIINTKAI